VANFLVTRTSDSTPNARWPHPDTPLHMMHAVSSSAGTATAGESWAGPVARVSVVVICPDPFLLVAGGRPLSACGFAFCGGRRAARPQSGRRNGRRCCSRSGRRTIGRGEPCNRHRAWHAPALHEASRHCPLRAAPDAPGMPVIDAFCNADALHDVVAVPIDDLFHA
jgi:hypothetical protein